jgi:hypothetical protein
MILIAMLALTITPGQAGPVGPATSEQDLIRQLGPARVKRADIYVGEGEHQPGTLVDGEDPARALAILWRDPATRSNPSIVFICYGLQRGQCQWKTAEGITIGTTLGRLEQLNGGPFRLFGFAWDYEGTVASWEGGALSRWDARGRLLVRLRPGPAAYELPAYSQVRGDREFSSAHPAMRKLNPTIYQMMLEWKQP